MKDFMLTDKDIEELMTKADEFRKKFSDEQLLSLERDYLKLNPPQFTEDDKVARIIVINDRTVVAPNVNDEQKTMIELCGVLLDKATNSIARKNGWTDEQFNQPEALASEKYMNFAYQAVKSFPIFQLVHVETETFRSDSSDITFPVMDCILNVVSRVASEVGQPFKEVLSKLTGDPALKEDVKKIMDNCWGRSSTAQGKTIFDIAPVWPRDGGLAFTYGFSGSNFNDDSWKKFLVGEADKSRVFYAAAFGVKYLESVWKTGSWEAEIEKRLSAATPDYQKLLDDALLPHA